MIAWNSHSKALLTFCPIFSAAPLKVPIESRTIQPACAGTFELMKEPSTLYLYHPVSDLVQSFLYGPSILLYLAVEGVSTCLTQTSHSRASSRLWRSTLFHGTCVCWKVIICLLIRKIHQDWRRWKSGGANLGMRGCYSPISRFMFFT